VTRPAFAIKVDVDTHVGLRDGAPRLLELFARHGVRASWFVSMGPDRTGRAVFRAFRQKGFLSKMIQSRAPGLYPLSTMLRGTLLPSIGIVEGQPDRLRAIEAAGHDVGLHGWDHVRWHDGLGAMSADAVEEEVGRAAELFEKILGRRPDCFAAPGWQCTAASLRATDRLGVRYRSDTRGMGPYLPRAGSYESDVPELPTTLPTLDEILGRFGTEVEPLTSQYEGWIRDDALNVHTVHTEVEGAAHLAQLDCLLGRVRDRMRICTLAEALEEQKPVANWPRATVAPGELPGRGGKVALQEVP
jgi:undecaprenyl phosphate-alpha-L-ara4FN deformylase